MKTHYKKSDGIPAFNCSLMSYKFSLLFSKQHQGISIFHPSYKEGGGYTANGFIGFYRTVIMQQTYEGDLPTMSP